MYACPLSDPVLFDIDSVAPKHFRRKAVAHLPTHEAETNILVFPHRQSARLRIALTMLDSAGTSHTAQNTIEISEHSSLEVALKDVQREIVDEEIFNILIREASALPTSSARVAERIIIVDVDHSIELRFEMVRLKESRIILAYRRIGVHRKC